MKTSQIGYFLTLCEDLSFSKAAERCGVAQSTDQAVFTRGEEAHR